VSVDWFFKLKEIDSLTKMRINYLKTRSDHIERISKLNDRRDSAVVQTAKLRQETMTLNTEMAEIDKKLKNASEQKQRIIDIGGDEKKILSFSAEIEQLEEKGMEFLSRQDEIGQEIEEAKTFAAGLEKTIHEIESETKTELDKIEQELENVELRQKLLLEELPADFKSLLIKITTRNLAHGPFTRIDQGSCFFCRFKISRLEEDEIDMKKSLKTCPQCTRIFLPYGS
jgi:predicted  nucleic acid-binding Zn-ribbon protein